MRVTTDALNALATGSRMHALGQQPLRRNRIRATRFLRHPGLRYPAHIFKKFLTDFCHRLSDNKRIGAPANSISFGPARLAGPDMGIFRLCDRIWGPNVLKGVYRQVDGCIASPDSCGAPAHPWM